MSKKIITSLLAGVFAFSMIVAPVSGQTVEELQAQIQQLLTLIAQLQQQVATLSGQGSTPGVTYCFSTDLYKGLTSNDVKDLQKALNLDPATRVASSGAGAPGYETTYFGSLTEAAVKKFQAKYGISTTGYVGPLTRAKLNELYCTPVTTPTTSPAATTTTTTVVPAYGTLSIQTYPVSNAQTQLNGGQEYELVAAQFKATGSDITVRKAAVTIKHSQADAFPWQAFTKLALYDGSTKLAEIVPSQTNAIEKEFAENYTFNFSGLNWVIPNNTTKVLTVKGTTVINPVANAISGTWTATIEADQLVYTDTAGVNYSSASGSDVASQNLTLASTQTANVTVSLATDNPKSSNVIVSSSGTTRAEVLKFNVEVKDMNATFNSGKVGITKTDGGTTGDFDVTAAELWDGSTLLASAAPSSTGATTADINWSNFSLPIAAGTTKTLSVKLVFSAVASTYAPAGADNVQVTTGPVLSGIDGNSNVVTANGNTLKSEIFYPFLKAPVFALSGATLTASGSTSSTVSDTGTAKIIFNVTALGGDIYLPTISNATAATTTITGIYKGGTEVAGASSSTAWTCSNVTEDSATTKTYRISSGATATCEVTTIFTIAAANAGFYEVKIDSIPWATIATTTDVWIDQTWGIDTLKTGLTYLSSN